MTFIEMIDAMSVDEKLDFWKKQLKESIIQDKQILKDASNCTLHPMTRENIMHQRKQMIKDSQNNLKLIQKLKQKIETKTDDYGIIKASRVHKSNTQS